MEARHICTVPSCKVQLLLVKGVKSWHCWHRQNKTNQKVQNGERKSNFANGAFLFISTLPRTKTNHNQRKTLHNPQSQIVITSPSLQTTYFVRMHQCNSRQHRYFQHDVGRERRGQRAVSVIWNTAPFSHLSLFLLQITVLLPILFIINATDIKFLRHSSHSLIFFLPSCHSSPPPPFLWDIQTLKMFGGS